MFRYRRYRAFLAFTIVAVLSLYAFISYGSFESATAIGAGSLKQFGLPDTTTKAVILDGGLAKETKAPIPVIGEDLRPPIITKAPALLDASTLLDVVPEVPTIPAATSSYAPLTKAKPELVSEEKQDAPVKNTQPKLEWYAADDIAEVGEGRVEVTPVPSLPAIHWSQQPEHFPVSSTIELPRGTPKAIPRIQYKFEEENAAAKADRLKKLQAVKDAAVHSWEGYRKNAWLHDEVSPVSGGTRDPFCGWAATLVDALDTLWIMGLEEEFEEAVNAVAKIDFTTSERKDIPLFETTIRYLGGMIAAYDISGAKYTVLLDKAVELAEVLIGAFDTPNRMPITFYHWMPTFASQPHRASSRVVLAEIGSLSVEFTRLAQLTKEPKYYDAIARITDAFEEWQTREQNATLVPGLWPTYLDASGCDKPARMPYSKRPHSPRPNYSGPMGQGAVASEPLKGEKTPTGAEKSAEVDRVGPKTQKPPAKEAAKVQAPLDEEEGTSWGDTDIRPITQGEPGKGKIAAWGKPLDEGALDSKAAREKLLEGKMSELGQAKGQTKEQTKDKRQLGGVLSDEAQQELSGATKPTPANHTISGTKSTVSSADDAEEICIPQGLMATSRYGNQHFTFGGMADSIYEYLPKQYILLGGLEDKYRTMYIRAIEAANKYLLYRPMTPDNQDILFAGEYRAFQEEDVDGETGRLETEGMHLTCFAGGMYALGAKIFDREEDLDLAAKLTEGCVWAYASTATGIMPESFLLAPCESREHCEWNETKYNELLDPYQSTRTRKAKLLDEQATVTASETETVAQATKAPARVPLRADSDLTEHLEKRQLDTEPAERRPAREPGSPVQKAEAVAAAAAAASIPPVHPAAYTPPAPPTHEEFVANRIAEERLPPGFTRITGRNYILRPEAIESVFYMWRITGDAHWREAGWTMFKAVQDATRTEFGNSAIDDVTKRAPRLLDSEESFWLAETLKYFYLLFSDESVVSLDDWVLNTEAHMFRRPDYGA